MIDRDQDQARHELTGTISVPLKLITDFLSKCYIFRLNLLLFGFNEERGKEQSEHGLNHRISLSIRNDKGGIERIEGFEWLLDTHDGKLLLAAWDIERGMYIVVLLEARLNNPQLKRPEYRSKGRILMLTDKQYQALSSFELLKMTQR